MIEETQLGTLLQACINQTPLAHPRIETPKLPHEDGRLTAYSDYFNAMSEMNTQIAESRRGIFLTSSTLAIEGSKPKTILFRNATKAKETFTDEEKAIIEGNEYSALWHATAAAACKYAEDIPGDPPEKRQNFIAALWEIETAIPAPGTSNKRAFNLRIRKLYSLLGALFPDQDLKTINNRLEAERDMILVDKPTDIVATYYTSSTTHETIYDIEIARTKLSDSQKTFFTAVQDNNAALLETYVFYTKLPEWQKAMLKRYAPSICERGCIRPSQMHFLPMAPNFWSRFTVAKTSETTHEIINVTHTHGALSARIKGLDKPAAIQFQKMQYDQLRANFNLSDEDSISYTNFMQHVPYSSAPDGDAAHHLRSSSSKLNYLISIPLGGLSRLYRILRPFFELFYTEPFNDNSDDPLLNDTFKLITEITGTSALPGQGNPIAMDVFLNLDSNIYPEDVKFDLEEAYRYAMKIHELQGVTFFRDNLRLASLRVALSSKLHQLKIKLNGTKEVQLTHKGDTFGCKSSIDRAKLVALHATVHAQKERLRRILWHTTFPQPEDISIASLKRRQTVLYGAMWISKNTASVVRWTLTVFNFISEKLTGKIPFKNPEKWNVLNMLSHVFTGKPIAFYYEGITKEIMERRVPCINTALDEINRQLADATITEVSTLCMRKNELLREKASLIHEYVKSETVTMSESARAGHTRAMPQFGGSTACAGVKASVRSEVAPKLYAEEAHLASLSKVASLNHGLAEKMEIKDKGDRSWVDQAHLNLPSHLKTCLLFSPPPKSAPIFKVNYPFSIN